MQLPCSFPDMWSGLSSGFTFDHSAGLVALPTENYRIQFYSLFDDVGISEVYSQSTFSYIYHYILN